MQAFYIPADDIYVENFGVKILHLDRFKLIDIEKLACDCKGAGFGDHFYFMKKDDQESFMILLKLRGIE